MDMHESCLVSLFDQTLRLCARIFTGVCMYKYVLLYECVLDCYTGVPALNFEHTKRGVKPVQNRRFAWCVTEKRQEKTGWQVNHETVTDGHASQHRRQNGVCRTSSVFVAVQGFSSESQRNPSFYVTNLGLVRGSCGGEGRYRGKINFTEKRKKLCVTINQVSYTVIRTKLNNLLRDKYFLLFH